MKHQEKQIGWLQPWALSAENLQRLVANSIDCYVFFWDEAQFEELGIGKSRQAFIYQALQQIDNVYVFKGAITELWAHLACVEGENWQAAQWHLLMAEHGQGVSFIPEGMRVQYYHPQPLVAFEKKIPFGYFGYWKEAQKQWNISKGGRAHHSSNHKKRGA